MGCIRTPFSLHPCFVCFAGVIFLFFDIAAVTLMTKYSVLFWLFGNQYLLASAIPFKQTEQAVFRTSALFGDHMVLQATDLKNVTEAALLKGYTSPHEVANMHSQNYFIPFDSCPTQSSYCFHRYVKPRKLYPYVLPVPSVHV